MAEKYKVRAGVIDQKRIATGIYDLTLRAESVARHAVPGQFVSLYCHDQSRLLPRPISLCLTDPESGTIRLVYRAVGAGTEEFSHLKPEDSVDLIGPLGNGYPLAQAGRSAFLIGGGIGIPPLLELSRKLACEKTIVLGYRDELFLNEEFEKYGNVAIATEDGSAGTKGNVLDAIRENGLSAGVIFACGPMPMLRAIKKYAAGEKIPCYLSLEERMACGVGACLGCVCRTVRKDEHSRVNNARVCTEGPVFSAQDVDI